MKTLMLILLCCMTALHSVSIFALNRPDHENYIKGVEALNNGNTEEAYKYLNNEINDFPDNGYAHCYMALICSYYGDLKLALHAANASLELIPKEDKEYQSFAYYTRGTLYMHAKVFEQAKKDLNQAISLDPEDIENYKTRAEILMNSGEYEASLNDLQTALKLDSHADVYDLMMQLLEANPDPNFFDKVTASYQNASVTADIQ